MEKNPNVLLCRHAYHHGRRYRWPVITILNESHSGKSEIHLNESLPFQKWSEKGAKLRQQTKKWDVFLKHLLLVLFGENVNSSCVCGKTVEFNSVK